MKIFSLSLMLVVAAGLAAIFTPDSVRAAVMFPLYVSNAGTAAIIQITSNSVASIFTSTGLNSPAGLAFDRAGNLYAANYGSSRIEKFSPNGVDLGVFASTGLNGPQGLAFDSEGNLYAAIFHDDTIQKFTPDGVGSVFANTGLNSPTGLAFDSAGNLYVANNSSGSIVKFTPNGVGSVFSTGLSGPDGLAFDSAGNLYVANNSNGSIAKFTTNGVGSSFATASTGLYGPEGLAFDNDGNLYVANVNNHQIVRFTPDGVPSQFNVGNLSYPTFIAFAPVPPFALRIAAVEKLGNDLRLSFTTQAGTNYAVQSRADLASGTWTTLPDTTNSGTGGIMQQTLTNALSQPQQFYRVQQW